MGRRRAVGEGPELGIGPGGHRTGGLVSGHSIPGQRLVVRVARVALAGRELGSGGAGGQGSSPASLARERGGRGLSPVYLIQMLTSEESACRLHWN